MRFRPTDFAATIARFPELWTADPMTPEDLLHQYAQGPSLLAKSLSGVSGTQMNEHPVPGTWSIREVICHLADAEIVYADRMKRVLVESNPTLFEWSPDDSIRDDLCLGRDLQNEMDIIRGVRLQMHSILTGQNIEVWQRTAVHTAEGPMTLETLLERIIQHIPHHLTFVEAKKRAMEGT